MVSERFIEKELLVIFQIQFWLSILLLQAVVVAVRQGLAVARAVVARVVTERQQDWRSRLGRHWQSLSAVAVQVRH